MPVLVEVSLTQIPKGRWEWSEENFAIDFSIRIVRSIVEVDCDAPSYKNEYFVEFYRRAFDLARSCVNVAAFGTGYGVYLIFEKFVGTDGKVSPIVFTNPPDFLALCTAYRIPAIAGPERQALEQILGLVMGDPALSMALNDLIQASYVPHVVPANCGRVVDGLRKLVAPGDPKASWPAFRNALQVDEAYVTFISEHSKNPRHGEHTRIDGPTTTEIHRRTWTIMNRFLEFRKRGNRNLTPPDFPLLRG